MTIDDTYSYTFPVAALSALINGDTSGLENKDEENLNEFLARESYVDVWDVDRDENGEAKESYFSKSPEFGLACKCVDVTGIVWKK